MAGEFLTLNQINAIRYFIKDNPNCNFSVLANNPNDGSLAIQIKTSEHFGGLLLNIVTASGIPITEIENIVKDEKYIGQYVVLRKVHSKR